MKVGAIDIGTNSILLLIAEVGADGAVVPLDDRCRIEGLGRGLDTTGRLEDAAVAATLDALREYAEAVEAAGCDRVAAVGTQALREAENRDAFLGPAREILGREIEVIGGDREAELVFAAVRASFPELARGELVVFDVGGGSTELIFGRGGEIVSLVSLPLGSVRMRDRFLRSDPPAPGEVAAMVEAVDEIVSQARVPAGVRLVGTAGTVTTLAAVSLGLEPYDPERVQGFSLARSEVERQLARYLELPVAERARLRGLPARRAEAIPAGAAIVARVMHALATETLTVSDRGVRYGLAASLAQADPSFL